MDPTPAEAAGHTLMLSLKETNVAVSWTPTKEALAPDVTTPSVTTLEEENIVV
jgi:hypothetical protein